MNNDDELTLEPDLPPDPDDPSGTLDAATGVDLPEHCVRTIQTLGEIVDGIVDGDLLAFNLTFESRQWGLQKLTFTQNQTVDMERLSVATMEHGHGLIKYLATLQGTAPPNNRSELRH